VHISISSRETVAPGDKVDIRFTIPGGDSISVGTWKVASADKGIVVADVVTFTGKPRVGQDALITTTVLRRKPKPRKTAPQTTTAKVRPVNKKPANPMAAPHIRQLRSGEADQVREGARGIYNRKLFSHDVLEEVDQVLRNGYAEQARGRMHTDAMAWLCKVLGAAGDKRYQATLKTVAQKTPSRKLKGYAQKSLKQLR